MSDAYFERICHISVDRRSSFTRIGCLATIRPSQPPAAVVEEGTSELDPFRYIYAHFQGLVTRHDEALFLLHNSVALDRSWTPIRKDIRFGGWVTGSG